MTVFINPFTDTGFKIIFGTEHVSEELLVSFLNGLFADDPVLSKIKTVKYLPSERVRAWDEGKSIVYDIHCQTSTGHKFILEMQLNEQEYFLKRAFYYFCRGIAEQGYKGQKSLKISRSETSCTRLSSSCRLLIRGRRIARRCLMNGCII